jgi:hypothetical protein
MTAATHYLSHGVYHHATGDKLDVQTVVMSDGTTVVGWLDRTPDGGSVICSTADGKTARLDARLIEWFDRDGIPYPSSNDKIADYFGDPVIAS